MDPEDSIYANVNIIIDATNTRDADASIENFNEEIGEEWNVDMQSLFITPMPSSFPTIVPSFSPSTLIPTATPSIAGLVVTLEVSFFHTR